MSMAELGGGLASAARLADGYHYAPGYWEQLPTAAVIGKIAVPALAVGILGVGSRAGMVTLALGCKGLSKAADYAEKKDLSARLTHIKNQLFVKATNVEAIKSDIGTAVWLTARAIVLLGISKWLTPTPPPSLLQSIFKNW